MRWPLQPSQRNHYEKLIITSQIAITSIYSLFNRCLKWNDHWGRSKKGSDLLRNENHRLVSNNDYIYIFSFCIHICLNYFPYETATLFPFLSYDKRNSGSVENRTPYAHRTFLLSCINLISLPKGERGWWTTQSQNQCASQYKSFDIRASRII